MIKHNTIIMITIAVALLLIAVTILVITNAKNNDTYRRKEYNIMDEYGSIHEVIEVNEIISVKYRPKYHMDITTWNNYINTRYESWDKYRNLVDTFSNEYFTAYVLPCYLLTPNEFMELIAKYNLTERLTFASINVRLKRNGDWLWNSYVIINESSPEKVMEKIISVEIEAVENLQRRFSDPEYLKILSEGNATSSIPFNITFEDIDIYVESFLVNNTLKELYMLRERPEILMVDLPLDLIARFKNNNNKSVIEIKRVIFGEPWLERENNYCKISKCRCKQAS